MPTCKRGSGRSKPAQDPDSKAIRNSPMIGKGNGNEMDANTIRIQNLCEYIRNNCGDGNSITLASLRAQVGWSAFHLQRRFKSAVGVTPRQYAEACRLESFRKHLRENGDVTTAIYDAGFGSSSRIYERVDARLGMTPGKYRARGEALEITYVATESVLGLMMLGATDRGLCFLQFGNSREELLNQLQHEFSRADLRAAPEPLPEQFRLWMNALEEHLRGSRPTLDLPLDIRATAFQHKVWSYLQSVPYGETQTYSDVAVAIGQPTAARAVARACASNRVALLIPCHRVIRGTGALGGYRWGLHRKQELIERERTARASTMCLG